MLFRTNEAPSPPRSIVRAAATSSTIARRHARRTAAMTDRAAAVRAASWLVACVAFLAPVASAGSNTGVYGNVNISAILDSMILNYDKRVRPDFGGPPVEVGITMLVLSISSVSEVQMDFTIDFYFRQFWTDPRLAFEKRPGLEMLSLESEFIKNIWVPDTFFVNDKHSYIHRSTVTNEYIRIYHSGTIMQSVRLTLTASCFMDLQYFPMDRQLCHLDIESFGYTVKDVMYKWNVGPKSVMISNEVSLPQFKVIGHRQKSKNISLSTGNFSRLKCEIQFDRSMGYYLIQIYIPSELIVVISWVSFWLNRNAMPNRVALCVTTVLTMTTLMTSTNASLPKISYVKAIDLYLGTCFLMVFASLLENSTVGYMAKRIQIRKTRFLQIAELEKGGHGHSHHAGLGSTAGHETLSGQDAQSKGLSGPIMPGDKELASGQTEVRSKVYYPKNCLKCGCRGNDDDITPMPSHPPSEDINKLCGITPSDIDKYSRIMFPAFFIFFNLTYWISYLYASDEMDDDLVLLDAHKQ